MPLPPQPPIVQSVPFNCPPTTLFELYMDSAKHAAVTNHPAKISRRAGGKFSAFNGALSGKNLLVIPNQLIVQTWKSTNWKRGDLDSILILQFSKTPTGSQVDLTHVNVPVQDHRGVTNGWEKYYWKPWRDYLAAKSKPKRRRR